MFDRKKITMKAKLHYAHANFTGDFSKHILFFEDNALKNLKENGLKALSSSYDQLITIPTAQLDTEKYSKMADENEKIAEAIFELTNNDQINPLSTKEMQQKIRESECKHTSMSVGDLIEIIDDEEKSSFMLCMNEGFQDVTEFLK